MHQVKKFPRTNVSENLVYISKIVGVPLTFVEMIQYVHYVSQLYRLETYCFADCVYSSNQWVHSHVKKPERITREWSNHEGNCSTRKFQKV